MRWLPEIHGSIFDAGAFAPIDGCMPRITYMSGSVLEADVTRNITSTPGYKIVKVHTGAGGPSNDKTWTVTKPDA
jgi:hypothetical protein